MIPNQLKPDQTTSDFSGIGEVSSFGAEQLCNDCGESKISTKQVCKDVNGVVRTAFNNLITHGRHPHEAVRSALVVLRIHQPSLCTCNMDRVRGWLLRQCPA